MGNVTRARMSAKNCISDDAKSLTRSRLWSPGRLGYPPAKGPPEAFAKALGGISQTRKALLGTSGKIRGYPKNSGGIFEGKKNIEAQIAFNNQGIG